jgi:hypothetical protein
LSANASKMWNIGGVSGSQAWGLSLANSIASHYIERRYSSAGLGSRQPNF